LEKKINLISEEFSHFKSQELEMIKNELTAEKQQEIDALGEQY